MKVVILAGGLGTRLSELTKTIPKPMIKIGPVPIVVHIMNHYLNYGFNDFILATGYKSFDFKKEGLKFNTKIFNKDCTINIIDTGKETLTGGRLKRVSSYLKDNQDFMFTYGDGVSNVNLTNLLKLHKIKKKLVTVTAVRPPARFGEILIRNNSVTSFKEKPQTTNSWINGGFFVANKDFLKFIRGDREILEKWPLEKLAKKKQLIAFKHYGFWKCMDVKRDRDELQKIYRINKSKKF